MRYFLFSSLVILFISICLSNVFAENSELIKTENVWQSNIISVKLGIGAPSSAIIDKENSLINAARFSIIYSNGVQQVMSPSVLSYSFDFNYRYIAKNLFVYTIGFEKYMISHSMRAGDNKEYKVESFSGTLFDLNSIYNLVGKQLRFCAEDKCALSFNIGIGYTFGKYDYLVAYRDFRSVLLSSGQVAPDILAIAKNISTSGPLLKAEITFDFAIDRQFILGAGIGYSLYYLSLNYNPWLGLPEPISLNNYSMIVSLGHQF